MLLNLTQGIARQSGYYHKLPWHFERRHPRPAASLEIGRIKALTHDDIRHGHFAAKRVGCANYGCFCDLRLLFQELLDFARVNVEATRNNEVTFAAAQR